MDEIVDRLFNVPAPRGTPYRVRARCDWEDHFCVDVFEFRLETCSIAWAAAWAEGQFPNHTIWQIERLD